MSERGNFSGGRGGGRGGDRGGRGGGGERGGRGGSQAQAADRKKENILDLTKYMDKELTVKFSGGREGRVKSSVLDEVHLLIAYSHGIAQGLRSIDELGS